MRLAQVLLTNVFFFYMFSSFGQQRFPEVRPPALGQVLAHLPGALSFNVWITQSNMNFKEEADIIRFLPYYNSQARSPSLAR